MKRAAILVSIAFLAACGGSEKPAPNTIVSKEPVSVRGWIDDVEGSKRSETLELETARRTQLFQGTNIWVDGADYVTGGVAENGAFILLDVPPGNATIPFAAPGAETAKLILQDIPGNADVFVPYLVLQKDGAHVVKPEAIKVRIGAPVAKAVSSLC